ncbi:hypothetical protein [Nocardia thraciensis]
MTVHAIGIVDLESRLIHEWIADDHHRLACRRGRIPQIHPEDLKVVEAAYLHLLTGNHTATAAFRIRLDTLDWFTIRAHWILVCHDHQPQALIDITLLPGASRK